MNDESNRGGSMATMSNEVEAALSRHNRNWMADGIVEIVLGSFWMLWASIVLLPVVFPGSMTAQLRVVLLLVSMAAMPFFLRRSIRGWKERVSVPRTGYVELKKPTSKRFLIHMAIGGALGFLFSQIFSQGARSIQQWGALALGIVMFLAMVFTAWRMQAMRLFVLSWVVLAAAIASFMLNFRVATCSGVLLLAYAFVCLVDGLLRLRSYLRAHPEPVGAAL